MKTKTKVRGKTRTVTRVQGPVAALRVLLARPEDTEGRAFWKKIGESASLVRGRADAKFSDSGADLVFFAKDRTHCALLDCKIGEAGLSPHQAFLYISQLAHFRKNLEFPISSASLIFILPEGSPHALKLLATFDESYKLPTLLLRKASISEARLGRGTRLAKNVCRYPLSVSYKDLKFDLTLSVKVVEAPNSLFEATKFLGRHVFVPIPVPPAKK